MDMPIERKNSFHLLLSDDELELLRLLAEREGLNPSDYLRTMLRQLAGTPAHLAAMIRVGDLMNRLGLTSTLVEHARAGVFTPPGKKKKPKKKDGEE
jgi:hypothetical protein